MSSQNSDENFIFYLEKLFLAFPSLLGSFLNSWQIYGPVLAFQVIRKFLYLSKIVIVIAFQVILEFCHLSKTVLFSVEKHLIITYLTFKTRELPWESVHMTLKWQSSFQTRYLLGTFLLIRISHELLVHWQREKHKHRRSEPSY